ncbi:MULTISPECIES: alanine--tRNA ligase-related protein [Catenuloplanes]|uniref:alanine--tRNA ligase n=1 Tax=Catenuloplanes niger TaxID=587534 RepID=A0AAE3ZMU4_9ACTN|nr:alanine--tRNA ligase-related protein [Catenuloplanes niger]MDR7321797.1 alanyl-tRNA synthetase [Catenuloplanes niger]
MRTDQTVRTFVDFYVERGHREIVGSTLIPPPGDPVLFTTSGMHPLTPYLTGRPHPLGRRLVDVQRCLRTTDLDEVGDRTHLTTFEMLGTWSLGDYDGPQSLRWGHELLTGPFGLDPGRLHATVHPSDELAPGVWRGLGVPVEITAENWWSNGPTGPCGPDSEIFYWTGDGPPTGAPTADDRWVEIWNHVTMRYDRGPDGALTPLGRPAVDTGLGLERLVTILQRAGSVYGTDGFASWFTHVPPLWPLGETDTRVVCDHLRSAIVVIGDGVRPANTGRGYVLRRLLRRVLTLLWRDDPGRTLGALPVEPVTHTIAHFGLPVTPPEVRTVLHDEERRFRDLLDRGRRVLSRRLRRGGPLREEDYRDLHDTHGLPRDLVESLLNS